MFHEKIILNRAKCGTIFGIEYFVFYTNDGTCCRPYEKINRFYHSKKSELFEFFLNPYTIIEYMLLDIF